MSGLGVSLITVSPNTTIKSSDANTNWQNLNNATNFNGDVQLIQTLSVPTPGNVLFLLGSGQSSRISGMAYASGGASGTFSHGLGIAPTMVAVEYAGNFGGPPANPAYTYNNTATTITVVSQSGFSWIALLYRN